MPTRVPKVITYKDITHDKSIRGYIEQADKTLGALGYTEHSFAHVAITANVSSMILEALGYSERECELARIAGFMHDIGNVVNRIDHAQSGAVIAFTLLENMGMPPYEIALIVNAIGHHDEATAAAVSPVAAALILADKTDVRRSRTRNRDYLTYDIHDRVNHAVVVSKVYISDDKNIVLDMEIDTQLSPVMDYFEIFLGRMLLCRKAAEFLKVKFNLIVNGQQLV